MSSGLTTDALSERNTTLEELEIAALDCDGDWVVQDVNDLWNFQVDAWRFMTEAEALNFIELYGNPPGWEATDLDTALFNHAFTSAALHQAERGGCHD